MFGSSRIRGKSPRTEKRGKEAQRYSSRTGKSRPTVRSRCVLRDGKCASCGTSRLRANSAYAPSSANGTLGCACSGADSDLGRNRFRSSSPVLIGPTALAVDTRRPTPRRTPPRMRSYDRQARGAKSPLSEARAPLSETPGRSSEILGRLGEAPAPLSEIPGWLGGASADWVIGFRAPMNRGREIRPCSDMWF
jgi:hypothetical protein